MLYHRQRARAQCLRSKCLHSQHLSLYENRISGEVERHIPAGRSLHIVVCAVNDLRVQHPCLITLRWT